MGDFSHHQSTAAGKSHRAESEQGRLREREAEERETERTRETEVKGGRRVKLIQLRDGGRSE